MLPLSFISTSLVGPKAPPAGEGRCADDNQHRSVSGSNAGHGRLLIDSSVHVAIIGGYIHWQINHEAKVMNLIEYIKMAAFSAYKVV